MTTMANLSININFLLIILMSGLMNSNNHPLYGQNNRARELGIEIGVMNPGSSNSITDVPGVTVGHFTKIEGENIRTGVTAILPHQGNIFQNKVPAAIYVGNGFGKLAGVTQVEELGNIETPILLTNTLSVPTALNALISYTLEQEGNEEVRSVNGVVGETNDGFLNDIQGRHISEEEVLQAIYNAKEGDIAEGNVGAGTGTICFGYKGGIGTASRKLPKELGEYTVGVLIQSNFGGVLDINGTHVGKILGRYPFRRALDHDGDGSCMIVILTDAPVNERNLKRMAKRALLGLGRTGGIASNGSGDYVIAVSNHQRNLIPYDTKREKYEPEFLHNDDMTALFMATIEATEEAIVNSLLAAEDMQGHRGEVKALPKEILIELMEKK